MWKGANTTNENDQGKRPTSWKDPRPDWSLHHSIGISFLRPSRVKSFSRGKWSKKGIERLFRAELVRRERWFDNRFGWSISVLLIRRPKVKDPVAGINIRPSHLLSLVNWNTNGVYSYTATTQCTINVSYIGNKKCITELIYVKLGTIGENACDDSLSLPVIISIHSLLVSSSTGSSMASW